MQVELPRGVLIKDFIIHNAKATHIIVTSGLPQDATAEEPDRFRKRIPKYK